MNLLCEVHFWSAREDIIAKHTDLGVVKYFSKKESNDSVLYLSKKSYFEERGIEWNPGNKSGYKLREKLKDLEEILHQNKVISTSWINDKLTFLLCRGLVVNIVISHGVVNSITFNKCLVPKLQSELISYAVIYNEQIACVCTDGRIICQGGPWRDGWIIEGSAKRKVTLQGEYLCVWGRVYSEHPQPWSPVVKDVQKANLVLYWVGIRGPELLAHKKTEGEPVSVIISKIQNKTVISIEQKVSLRGAVCVEVTTLEVTTNALNRVAVTSVPLQTQVSCCTLSDNENHLILGCIDGSLALLDRSRGSTRIVKTTIIPTFAVWHRCGALAAISNEKGQIQYFDIALNCINTQLGEDSNSAGLLDLSAYFNLQPNVSSIKWGPQDLIVILDHGPLVLVRYLQRSLSFTSLAQQYLKIGKIQKTIALLLSWEWNDQCFNILQQIMAYLLKLPLTEENAKHLQNTLSSFHNPPGPLSTNVKHKYGSQVRALTRRFFHQLVRYKMFETAFLLAVDIGHHDLFMDLYYCATQIGEREMAAAARAQASALLSRCSSEASCCSRSSCSQCSDSYETSSNEDESPRDGHVNKLQVNIPMPPQVSNENFLTTDFNDVNPKTYQSENYAPPIQNMDFPKAVLPPKPVICKPPIVPPHVLIRTPPLPIAPPLPITPLNTSIHSQLGIPTLNNPCSTSIYMDIGNHRNLPPPFWGNYGPSNSIHRIIPPINQLTTQSQSVNPVLNHVPYVASTAATTAVKKQQAKVKFSDTVTAFIVPEVKRPVRPPPPPHITDPQKELADSLPLCHPNEDYLKDFTPARRNEPDEPPAQSKIKVVHFGVV